MKKVLFVISILSLLVSVVLNVNAHSGRTDGSGGHTNHSTGEYHYHHGHSAHEHYDMDGDGDKDCPYDFKDKTDHSSGGSYSNSDTDKKDAPSKKITLDDVLMAMLECLLPAIGIGIAASYLLFYLFYLIWGEKKCCSISSILFVVISVIAYIWLIYGRLS